MSYETWVTWGVPGVALLFGGFALLLAWLSSRDFDRRYGPGPK
jgi:cytochrome c-type biogenesis protein CcmH/NrfF